ncbi:MAG: hypothetical protein IJC93_06125 [Clostridia bacterium]|nr:hypothetical protein [Clostridia bacterium]
MHTVTVDFSRPTGAVKPMHAVNNGPVYKFAADQRITNIDHFRAAGIPYARTHDASFYATYGGEHTVDVNMIFPNFDADPEDPASYDFCLTDEYLRVIEFAGVKTFYRLGSKIEHWPKKYNTLPPKDFKKWAVICEHIIRHYTEGWADGFRMDIEYWEIWNEPDLDPDDSVHKRCWGGTKAQFFEFYDTAARHLKACFPHLKIGGPAIAGNLGWAEEFLAQLSAPLDFFSWHIYANEPIQIAERTRAVRALLDRYGFTETESILNEWNYVRGWNGDDWYYTLKAEKSLKGAAFIAATMCLEQYEDLELLMYYDARPCGMNGLFDTDLVCDRLKGYYPFQMFNELYKLDCAVAVEASAPLYAVAAKGETRAAAMLVHYADDDAIPAKTVKLDLSGFAAPNGVKVSYSLLDETHDADLVRGEIFTGESFSAILELPLFGVSLVELEAL